jgi:RNA polymerase sigma factor (sigma-70 family)
MPSQAHAPAPSPHKIPPRRRCATTSPAPKHRNTGIVRDQLIEDHLSLVRTIAACMIRSAPPTMSFDDLVAWGNQGLVTAATSFDPSRRRPEFAEPITFAQYAERRIKGAMLDGARKEGPFGDCRRRKHLPQLERVGISDDSHLDQLLAEQQPASLEVAEVADYRRLVLQLGQAVDQLPPDLRAFTRAHYYNDVPLHAVGRQLGVSKFAVQRLRNAAIRQISTLLVTSHRNIPNSGELQ